jgi:hypothetical protein
MGTDVVATRRCLRGTGVKFKVMDGSESDGNVFGFLEQNYNHKRLFKNIRAAIKCLKRSSKRCLLRKKRSWYESWTVGQ